jgi:hypothetical protein
MNKFFKELENLSENGFYTKDRIEWWLLKYNEDYKHYYNDKETRPGMKITYRADASSHRKESIDLLNKINVFLDTYEVLLEVLECYKNEIFYKGQIEYYNKVKEDDLELSSWLQTHLFDEGEMQTNFNILFQNTSKESGYEFIIRYPFSLPVSIKLNESDFCYTLQLLSLLKTNK